MAISKYPFGRYQVIDRELCRRDFVKTNELKEIIERELSINVSKKMINEDINAMRYDSLLGYNAPIDYNHSKKAYFYKDKNYTIKAFGLKESDINALMFYAKAINQYKDYEVFEDFSNAIEKVLDAVNIRKGISTKEQARLIVQTETTPKVTGSELIPQIVKAINSNSLIEIEYQKFCDKAPFCKQVAPYLLKEDRHRWYVIGKTPLNDKIKTYALDRIKRLTILETKFIPTEFDFNEHFAYSFGITVPDLEPLDVIMSFNGLQGYYLKTLPIHLTQKILIDDENEFRISVRVKPSWEFYEKILGYGGKVKVLSPQVVIDNLRSIAEKILKRYQ
ncbi:MAG: WYL domain-containing protein [Paludibacter sp.]|nr:WYL domain-containing protein [Paludibacter sp.]